MRTNTGHPLFAQTPIMPAKSGTEVDDLNVYQSMMHQDMHYNTPSSSSSSPPPTISTSDWIINWQPKPPLPGGRLVACTNCRRKRKGKCIKTENGSCTSCLKRRDKKPCEWPVSNQGRRNDLLRDPSEQGVHRRHSKNQPHIHSTLLQGLDASGAPSSMNNGDDKYSTASEPERVRGKKLLFCD
ncbi:hypothetical protein PENSPDRAFT_70639 [Peniophora sp. CONT]|nr:hypothetical protein PENSPDRAFT_70639 [Peniophora sp. CONT]